jgi:competence protein ComEA
VLGVRHDLPPTEVRVDPNAAPWRALETAGSPGEEPASAAAAGLRLPWTAIAAGLGSVVLAAVAFLLAFGSGSGELQLAGGTPLSMPSGGPASSITATGDLVVEIVGAVERPGVYRLPTGSRIGDLVERAGGYGPRVDIGRAGRELNLAAPLTDGDQVRVPSRDEPSVPLEAAPGATGGPAGAGAGGPLDLNRATQAELESLPGIGPVTAGKILAAREEQPFAAVDDLRTRKLVGEKTFEKVRELVTVR